MTERDALLRAVLAHPHEDTPRLVLADWFDEDGEGDCCGMAVRRVRGLGAGTGRAAGVTTRFRGLIRPLPTL